MQNNLIGLFIGTFYIISVVWIELAYKKVGKRLPLLIRIVMWIMVIYTLYSLVKILITLL
jgi:hypothetical protein